ncbi:interferon-inducible GTPase-domain-containing protein [Kalaharituber pfeilii]|nr:interferon-inducible GTPase-domain-containing protein [Kalaharituber pfeilii]
MSFWQNVMDWGATIGDASMRAAVSLSLIPTKLPAFIAEGLWYIIAMIFKTGPTTENPIVCRADLDLMNRTLVQYNGVTLTQTDHQRIKKELDFKAGSIHIAIAGSAGTGKSSLINAFRGLRVTDHSAAPTDVVECTRKIARYPDPRYPWIVWFDIPGGGTNECPGTGYFERNGLYLMDCIIVVCGDRFLALDIEILKRAREWNITALVVRSKSDVHIRNLATENEDPDDEDLYKQNQAQARKKYITESKKNFEHNLKLAGLTRQFTAEDLFLVSAAKLRQLMTRSEDIPEAKKLEKEASSSLVRDEAHVRKWGKRLQEAREKFMNNLLSSPVFIDEQRLVLKVFSSIGESRYS